MCPSLSALLAGLFMSQGTCLPAVEQPAKPTTIWRVEQPTQIGGHATTVLGAPRIIAEPDGKSVGFNGTTDGLLLPVNPLEGSAAFTIEVLFKPESGGPAEQRFLHVQDGPGNRALMEIRLTDAGWALDTFLQSEQRQSKLPLLDRTKLHPADRWTWVALVYANGHMAHYINGAKELEGDVAFAPMEAGQISLGVRQNKVYWFQGSIREVRFHPTALPPAELQQAKSN